MNGLRDRITYANVVSTLALFAVLAGGTALAVGGKIGTKRLKNSAVKTSKIANGAVTNPKLATGAVSAAKIAPGAVGAAQLADGSVALGDLAPATLTELDDDCPLTLSAFQGICMNGSNLPANTWILAAQNCANMGLVLPDTGMAMTIGRNVVGGTELWTSDVTNPSSGTIDAAVVVTGQVTNPTATVEAAGSMNTYRCVSPLRDG